MENLKHVIYKTYDRYTEEEINDVKKCFDEDELECLSEEEIAERLRDIVDMYYYDDFGKNGNIYYTKDFNERTYTITGTLGLWDGDHVIDPVDCETFIEAVDKCIAKDIESFEIYELFGELHINAWHHDGCNRFTIRRKLSDGVYEPAKLREHVFGCETDNIVLEIPKDQGLFDTCYVTDNISTTTLANNDMHIYVDDNITYFVHIADKTYVLNINKLIELGILNSDGDSQ